MNHLTRREFFRGAAAALAAAQCGATILADQRDDSAGLPTRPLGRTGVRIPIIGLGGWDIGAVPDEKDAIAIMHEAIDNGLTFFDNCWDYHEGRSEQRMGKALAGNGRRDKVFLMTKVCARDYQGALKHLDDSLRRMQTDRLDLWQFHGIQWKDDPQLIFAAEGALKAALEAQKAGKVRFIGFTGHKDPEFHLAMLQMPFDYVTAQMPLNILDAHYRSFQKLVLPECGRRGVAVLGMKALGSQRGRIVRETGISAEICRRYSLSLPIVSLVCGINTRENLRQDLAIARNFQPMTPDEVAALHARSAEPAQGGKIELYKTGNFGCDWHHKNPPPRG